MAGMSYSDLLIAHYEHPHNVGAFDEAEPHVGRAQVGTVALGGVIQLQIACDPARGVIRQARFKAYGSAPVIACASLACEWLEGKTLAEALAVGHGALAQALALPPLKLACALLTEDAIEAAVHDYRTRHGTPVPVA